MTLSQVRALSRAAAGREADRQAAMILAVNIGSQGGKDDIKKALRRLQHAR